MKIILNGTDGICDHAVDLKKVQSLTYSNATETITLWFERHNVVYGSSYGDYEIIRDMWFSIDQISFDTIQGTLSIEVPIVSFPTK